MTTLEPDAQASKPQLPRDSAQIDRLSNQSLTDFKPLSPLSHNLPPIPCDSCPATSDTPGADIIHCPDCDGWFCGDCYLPHGCVSKNCPLCGKPARLTLFNAGKIIECKSCDIVIIDGGGKLKRAVQNG